MCEEQSFCCWLHRPTCPMAVQQVPAATPVLPPVLPQYMLPLRQRFAMPAAARHASTALAMSIHGHRAYATSLHMRRRVILLCWVCSGLQLLATANNVQLRCCHTCSNCVASSEPQSDCCHRIHQATNTINSAPATCHGLTAQCTPASGACANGHLATPYAAFLHPDISRHITRAFISSVAIVTVRRFGQRVNPARPPQPSCSPGRWRVSELARCFEHLLHIPSQVMLAPVLAAACAPLTAVTALALP